ncbi:ABC transporter substrate-binding protein [Gorillibacterium massiliense]|uniref:ABC transporter substrate-binding protein n=1 Tax=Gorillibacterium massiliense TaxID=1280390 RepID=UPI0004BB32BB|nr:extracellular solute-binding protein [Gorillibacterium massiliense]
MRKRKWPAAIAATSAIAMIMAGCASGAKTDEQSAQGGGEKVTLEYYTWTDEASYMQKIVDAFNAANSDVQVHMNTISNASDEYNTKMMLNLSSGSTVDVYSINGSAGLSLYYSKKQLLDISDRIKQANLDVGAYGPILQDITGTLTAGKYYALPYRTSAYALFYNKDILDKAGIAYPKQLTWDQYADLAKQLTKGDGADKQWGGFYADWIFFPLEAIQKGSTILDDNLDNVKEWLNFQDRIFYKDQSHMSYKQMKAESVDWLKQFESGNVAMLVNGEWTINMLKADIEVGKTNINFDMTVMPQPEGAAEPTSVGGLSTFMGINPNSKKQDAAFKFVQFAAGEEGELIMANSSVLPAYSNDKTKKAFLAATGLQGSGAFFEANTVIDNQPIPQIDQVNTAYMEQRDLFLFQEQDVDKTIHNFVTQRDSILKK